MLEIAQDFVHPILKKNISKKEFLEILIELTDRQVRTYEILDNDINWEIISAMLSMFGITADRAENGRVCVDMISEAEEGSYTLIFMDVQMPEMNGLDATRTIRKLENSWAASIPIVAMTADAFSENIMECMDAGMNGHIAKPIDVKLVIKEIRRIKEERGES